MKTPKPYFTNYPFRQWFWFDKAVYAKFPPKGVGDLPTEIFKKLRGGKNGGASRSYRSEELAWEDYKQAITDDRN